MGEEDGMMALLCPEMTYELEIIDPLLFAPLPQDVKTKTVKFPEFWLPDEAASIYSAANAVMSFECHSPIIAVSQGTPAFYVHQPQDGIKGQMWLDLGLGDSYFEVESATAADLAAALLGVHRQPERAIKTVEAGVRRARALQRAGVEVLRESLRGGASRP